MTKRVEVVEGVVYDPGLDSHARAIRTDDDEYVYVEGLLYEGERVRITIEVLEPDAKRQTDDT